MATPPYLAPTEHVRRLIAARGYLESEQAAEFLGCSLNYLRNKLWTTYRVIEPVKLGNRLYWRKSDLAEYAARHPRIGKNRRTKESSAA
jgi:helix-turn-helix protein